MRYFELMESDLPSEQFLLEPEANNGRAKRRIRFRPNSAWSRHKKVGQRLTWRGRSFVEAFAEVNRREIMDASFLDLSVGKGHVALETWRSGQSQFERYHFICQASEGAYMRVGEERVTPCAGELWRIDDRFHPAVLRGGIAGSVHLVLLLAPQQQAQVEPSSIEAFFDPARIIAPLQRSQVVG
jgi:hypothetical protein